MRSCLYRGTVRHRRTSPREHVFGYPLFMAYLDLAELDHVFDGRRLWSVERRNVASFRRADHLGDPSEPLEETVRELLRRETGRRPGGRIGLLTHLRYLGYCFNPVSFYYVWDEDGSRVESVVADVANTPWNEHHAYVLHDGIDEGDASQRRYRFGKCFHVSPFQDMDTSYDWRFSEPGRALAVHMECSRGDAPFFTATLSMERREMNGSEMARVLVRHPFMTGRVIAGIYVQAAILWARRMPFHVHPAKRVATESSA